MLLFDFFLLKRVERSVSRSETAVGNNIYFIRILFPVKVKAREMGHMIDGVQPFQNQKHKVINIPTKVLDTKY